MKQFYIPFAIVLLMAVFGPASAQRRAKQDFSVTFSSDGKIEKGLPDKLFAGDQITFQVSADGSQEKGSKDKYLSKLKLAQKHLDAIIANPARLAAFRDIFQITKTELENVRTECIDRAGVSTSVERYVPKYIDDTKPYLMSIKNLSTVYTPTAFAANTPLKPVSCNLAASERKLICTVGKVDGFKKTVFDWFQSTSTNFTQPAIDFEKMIKPGVDLKDQIEAVYKFIQQVKKTSGKDLKSVDNFETLKSIADEAGKLAASLKQANQLVQAAVGIINKEWVLRWLWYQDAEVPSLNPLGFRDQDPISTPPDTSMAGDLRYKISTRQELYNSSGVKKMSLTQIEALIDEVIKLKKELAKIQQDYKRSVELKTKNETARKDFQQTSVQLNTSILFVSTWPSPIYSMRHHDAQDNNNLLNDVPKDEYSERSDIIILQHNLKPNEKYELHLVAQDITSDRSIGAEIAAPLIQQISSFIGGFKITGAGRNPVLTLKQAQSNASQALISLQQELGDAEILARRIDYLASQSNVPTDLKEDVDKTNSYHTDIINSGRKLEGPKKVKYFLTKVVAAPPSGSSPATPVIIPDTFAYRVNKLYRVFPFAGVNYTFTRFNDISFDSATKQSKVTTRDRANFVVGIKVFLRKCDIRNTKFIFGKDDDGRYVFLSRTSLSVAFDIRKPLDNLYGGINFDLVPGLALGAGCTLNRYNYQQFADNRLVQTKTLYRPGFYVGVTTDLSLFSDVLKLLNLSK